MIMRKNVAIILVIAILMTAVVVPVAADTRTYTVRSGDTVYLIAQRFDVSTQNLIEMNGIAPPYSIHPGQVLVVGMSESAPSQPPSQSNDGGFLGLNWGDLSQSYGWLALFAVLRMFGIM